MGKVEGEGKDQMEEEALIQAYDGSKANLIWKTILMKKEKDFLASQNNKEVIMEA